MLSAALLATFLVAAASAEPCTSPLGTRVVLESDEVDPDVFLWDSRLRLIDYAAGNWGDTRAIFAHTVLAEPGTLALVIACFPGVAHPRFSDGDEDAIGVKVVNGRYRGRYGWVLSSDTHAIRSSGGSSEAGEPHVASQTPGSKR
ncbi:MAG: hypothetical protein WAJ85_02725 [Candidatus Baltobacteraceae bacterium]